MPHTCDGKEALVGALDELDLDESALAHTDGLWRLASLVAAIEPDRADTVLAEQFAPAIVRGVGEGNGRPPGMIAPDAPRVGMLMADEPAFSAVTFDPQTGRLSGHFSSDDCEPLFAFPDPMQPPHELSVDETTGRVRASVPVLATRENADRLTGSDLTHWGTVTIDGTVYAPPADLYDQPNRVPQVVRANVSARVRPGKELGRTAFDQSAMVCEIARKKASCPPIEDCIEDPSSGACTNSGAICWTRCWSIDGKCTTIRTGVITACTCMLRP